MDRSIIEQNREALFLTNYRLHLTIPSILAEGERFCLRMTAVGPDNMPTDDFDRKISLSGVGVEGLPAVIALAKGDDGQLTIDNLRAVGPERAYIEARVADGPGAVRSNPAWVEPAPSRRLYWGDLHVHTTLSDCRAWACKSPEFGYAYARDVSHLDFAAAADHLRGIAQDWQRWRRLQRAVQDYDAPGGFVPFLAFESSHKSGYGGDINVYYRGMQGPYFWPEREDMSGNNPAVRLEELWGFLDETRLEYATIPHHTGRVGKYRSFADPDYNPAREPVFEIYSGWGSSERRGTRFPISGGNSENASYFVDALKAGCRYGVIASSDDHHTMPGGQSQPCAPGGDREMSWYMQRGLAAVWAEELTREALWDGIVSRRCYGTTYARTLLDIDINGIGMGQQASVGRADSLRRRRTVRIRCLTADSFATDAVLVRNGEEIARRGGVQDETQVVFEDDAALSDVAVRGARFHPAPFVAYYVRLENRFSQTQWSSPIWLDLA